MSDPLYYPYKDLPFTLDDIKKSVDAYPTPFHLYNEPKMRANAKEFAGAFQQYFPGFRNYFAVKATPTPAILKVLKDEGMGADCSSLPELLLAERVGFRGEDIFFTSNDTPVAEYRKAMELGAVINIDAVTEIDFLLKNIGRLPELMCLRYNPGPLKHGGGAIGDPVQSKFGLTRDQVKQAYTLMKANGVKRYGLHCMVASNEMSIDYFKDTAKIMFELVVEVWQELGIYLEFVDLGGGIGVAYQPGQSPVSYTELAKGTYEMFHNIIIGAGIKPMRILMECGRVVTGPYGCLVSRTIHRKVTYKNYIGLDSNMANFMMPALYKTYVHISVVRDGKLMIGYDTIVTNPNVPTQVTDVQLADVVGSLCMNSDKFAIDRPLPDIQIGDIIVMHDTGAHGHAMGFNFNGKLRSAEVMLMSDGTLSLMRRAETVDDYFTTLTAAASGSSNKKCEPEKRDQSVMDALHEIFMKVTNCCTICQDDEEDEE